MNDYFKLFLLREGKVVLGSRYANVILLTGVLMATFFAIAFSNGSLIFLAGKMKDPFINWVDIAMKGQEGDVPTFQAELQNSDNALSFGYEGYENGYEYHYFFFGKNGGDHEYLKCRFFDHLNTPLVAAILDPENVISGCAVPDVENISENSIGVIITQKALMLLGYEKDIPAYIDLYAISYGADEVGIETYEDRARAPIPVIGAVKRLPGNVDIVASTSLYVEYTGSTLPFNLNKDTYGHSLCFFVPPAVDAQSFATDLENVISEKSTVDFVLDDQSFYPQELFSYKHVATKGKIPKEASYIKVQVPDSLGMDFDEVKAVCSEILDKYAEEDVHRLYEYEFSYDSPSDEDYISVHFNTLNKISEFQTFANALGFEIEMSQINAKENFNSVRLMAGILSWAMIFFAIVCIILFIVNLLQSYFQRIKKNLGTFKAFGMSNKELTSVYLLITLFMIAVSTVLAFVLVWLVQLLLPVLGVLKEGTYNYLSIFSFKTALSILFIILSSALTVWLLMNKLLESTPGDLIYDR